MSATVTSSVELPGRMRAFGHPGPRPLDAPDALIAVGMPVPAPAPHDLLVRVRAAAANPIDVRLRASGRASAEAPRILGFEAAGEVVACGAAVTRFSVGDRVFHPGQINRPGCFADFTLVDERIAGPMPKRMDFADAAALPMTGLTAYELLFERMGIAPESAGSLLIVNGAGGVGSVAIQLARALTRLTVIATATRPESIAWCRDMGAHHVISHHAPLSEGIAGLGLGSVDWVASLARTDLHLPEIVRVLRPLGTLGLIDDPKTLDVMPLRAGAQRLAFEGVFVRALSGAPDMARQHEILTAISALADTGRLQSTRCADPLPLDLEGLREGQARLEAGHTVGKIVHLPT